MKRPDACDPAFHLEAFSKAGFGERFETAKRVSGTFSAAATRFSPRDLYRRVQDAV